MTTTRLENKAMTSNYEDIQKMIFLLAHKYSDASGIEYNELVSHGNYAFMKAHSRYRKTMNASYTTWIYFYLDKAMLSFLRKNMKHMHNTEADESNCGTETHTIFLTEILEELSPQAQKVVIIILDSDNDFHVVCEEEGVRTPNQMFVRLRRYLRSLGWKPENIRNTFQEIKIQLFQNDKALHISTQGC